MQNRLIGGTIKIVMSSTLYEATIISVSSSGTLALASALPSAPTVGTFFAINPPEQVLVNYHATSVMIQNDVGETGTGTAVSVKWSKTLIVEIFGASSRSGTVSFQAASVGGPYVPITGINLNGFAKGSSTSPIFTTPAQWQFDIEALDSFRCPVSGKSGTITVQGRLQS